MQVLDTHKSQRDTHTPSRYQNPRNSINQEGVKVGMLSIFIRKSMQEFTSKMLRNPLGGLLYLTTLYLSSFFGSIFIMGPSLPLLLCRPSWFRWFNDRAIGLWLILPAALLELLYGVKVLITGVKPPINDSSLIIMNHRSRLDWMYYWCFLHRYGQLKHEKIILKNDLKNIPGPGWAMQNAMYIFLKRRWEHDKDYLREVLDYFKEVSYPVQLLLFPEGTNLDSGTKVKSDSFARKNNLPCYEYVLHPRVRGFTYCVEKLRHGRLDAIHNVTVGYDVNHSFWEIDLLCGNFPHEMHFHIERNPIEMLPSEENELEKWCTKKWEEKEEMLRNFYASGQGFCPHEEAEPRDETKVELEARNQYNLVILFWHLFIVICFLGIYYSLIIRWYFYIMCATYLLLSFIGKGTDRLQLWSHNKYFKKKD